MKSVCLIFAGSSFCLSLFFSYLSFQALTFQSLESKTEKGEAVFNQVRFISSWEKDIWIMRQSHQGLKVDKELWDRLAIVVDKKEKPYEAHFFQLEPGGLVLEKNFRPIAYKARCFACHPNGPRAVRPQFLSKKLKLSWVEKTQVFLWNLRIKTYGKLNSRGSQPRGSKVPFRSRHAIFKRPLELESCQKCHSSSGIRSPLSWEHLQTAHFLVNQGFMPPFPFKVSLGDREKLQKWSH